MKTYLEEIHNKLLKITKVVKKYNCASIKRFLSKLFCSYLYVFLLEDTILCPMPSGYKILVCTESIKLC